MNDLNYHHLRYFHAVAHDGNLTRTAARLNLSQSALSAQIRTLEDRLGQALFERRGRQLILTEIGKIALSYADQIFEAGAELTATLQRAQSARPTLRIGALSTLSRNFQLQFLRPILSAGDIPVSLRSGSLTGLLDALTALELDVVLSTNPPPTETGTPLAAQKLSEQAVHLHAVPERLRHDTLADLLRHEPLILPTEDTIYSGFNALVARLGVTPNIAAEVDDMAMVRLLAREGAGVAVAPDVVLADEIASGVLRSAPFDLPIVERFFAITAPRAFPHPALDGILSAMAVAK